MFLWGILTLRMPTVWTLVVLLLFLGVLEARFVSAKSREKPCGHVSTFVLMEILGPAFNYRYMRLDTPSDFDEEIEIDFKRDTQKKYDSFYVTDPYALEISNKPAWMTDPVKFVPSAVRNRRDANPQDENRTKRASDRPSWSCESRIRWQDLGPDFFPRYLRSVECTQTQCYYGHYDCRPRFFTVRLLRRRKGECAALQDASVDLWVWEERAVAMCCDCVSRSRYPM